MHNIFISSFIVVAMLLNLPNFSLSQSENDLAAESASTSEATSVSESASNSEATSVSESASNSEATSVSESAPAPDENVWEQIENSYYINSDDASSQFHNHKVDVDNLDMGILEGGDLDESSITEFYESKIDFVSEEEIEKFKQDVKENGIFPTLEFNNRYWAVAKRNQDSKPSTAIIHDDKITQLNLRNNGKLYKLTMNDDVKNKLSESNLDLSKTKAYFALFSGLGRTIIFDDGENQLIQFMGSYHDIIEDGSVFTVDELFVVIDENIDGLLREVYPIEDGDDEKMNYPTGGLD